VQDDALNQSRLDRIVVCALTSNLGRVSEPGNVLLKPGEGGLERQSVVIVSQVASVKRSDFGSYIGKLDLSRVDEVLSGLRFQQRAFFGKGR
jgi:mRNA interferase MazF